MKMGEADKDTQKIPTQGIEDNEEIAKDAGENRQKQTHLQRIISNKKSRRRLEVKAKVTIKEKEEEKRRGGNNERKEERSNKIATI